MTVGRMKKREEGRRRRRRKGRWRNEIGMIKGGGVSASHPLWSPRPMGQKGPRMFSSFYCTE
jgi:hypothetical protein